MVNWKKMIPPSARLSLRVLQRQWQDRTSGTIALFPNKVSSLTVFPTRLQLQQPIKVNAYSENKRHNLCIATQALGSMIIQPGQIFSFWHFIPRPTAANGYLPGRNLLGEQLALDVGGGLCQLSGIIYHLALMAGLDIIERHPHSRDIYTEATRYTPLGSDATVVFGYKDLRIRNNLSLPFYFSFEVAKDRITVYLCTALDLVEHQLSFESQYLSTEKVQACVFRWEKEEKILLSKDVYKRKDAK